MANTRKKCTEEHYKTEKIDGVIFNMSPAPHYQHSIAVGNLYNILSNGLKDSLCMVFMEHLDYKYHSEVSDDFLEPDIMVICDRKHLKGGTYSGIPKFIAEALSPATAMRDMTVKKDIYEQAGVEEYWIISPRERGVEIYYLVDGKYRLVNSLILEDDEEDEHYNAGTIVALKCFPDVKMTLAELFDKVRE